MNSLIERRNAGFVVGEGEMAELIRNKDWAATSLGPLAEWPQSLRTTVSLCLASNFPINIIWGPDHIQIYNDGYKAACGEAHPRALGENYSVTWASAWPAIGEPFARALAGETTFLENQRMFLTRNGYLEETFFTFSTSPILAEDGSIGGLFHPVAETTATMLAERRTRTLRDLSPVLDSVTDRTGLVAALLKALDPFKFDLPVLLIYELDDAGTGYHLTGSTGIDPRASTAVESMSLQGDQVWPVDDALKTLRLTPIPRLPAAITTLPCGPYAEPPAQGVLLPISAPGTPHPPVMVVVGVSPRLPFDDGYRNFLELLGSALAGLLGAVRALEDERRRAEALAEIDRAKTVFFSNVSHEFRTPLTLLLGPLEQALAPDNDLAPLVREKVTVAHRNGLRLLKLVNTLLDFSRIEAGRARASFQQVDLVSLTAAIASSFRSAAEAAGLTLTVAAAAPLPPVFIDRDMWETIVLNLLSNAFKFTFSGSINVSLLASADGAHVGVAVRDTGTGIPSDQLARLFERFHRVEGAAGRSYEGTGIGLALVQELVKLHGGTVEVTSTIGEGTTFEIRLPIGRAHLRDDQIETSEVDGSNLRAAAYVEEALRWLPSDTTPAAAPPTAATQAGSAVGHVLLADDNSDMRDYISRLLVARGIEVTCASDGVHALAAARARVPDLVLTDVMMPGMDGFELLAALRADPLLREVPIILLSARAGQEARVEGLASGADDYLIKPFAAGELIARVVANLRLHRDRRRAAAAVARSEARLRTVFQTSYQYQGLLATDGVILDANATSLAGIGQPLEAVLGKPFWEAPWFSSSPQMRQRIHAAVVAAAAGHTSRHELRLHLPVGGTRAFDFTVRPVFDDQGRVQNIVPEAVDITARTQAEEALRESQKLEAVGRLTGGVAHDFNNLMMVVSGAISVLERPVSLARQRKALGSMRRAVERGASLTRHLLTFGGRSSPASKPINLQAHIGGMLDLLDRALAGNVRVVTRFAPDLWPVEADPEELELTVLNLCVNARDAMTSGGTISIDVENRPRRDLSAADGDLVRITVADTGAGMSPEVRARAFEPFFTTKELGKGSGVGLAQVYGFATASGGTVEIHSEVDRGTQVSVLLPRSLAAPPAPLAGPVNDLVASPRQQAVLMVEDDPEVSEVVAEMLASMGYSVVTAAHAAGALATLERATQIDLVFSDVMLPDGMNGLEMALEIRRKWPDLPIVMTTGYPKAFAQQAMAEGLTLLPKPYALQELQSVLERVLTPCAPD